MFVFYKINMAEVIAGSISTISLREYLTTHKLIRQTQKNMPRKYFTALDDIFLENLRSRRTRTGNSETTTLRKSFSTKNTMFEASRRIFSTFSWKVFPKTQPFQKKAESQL